MTICLSHGGIASYVSESPSSELLVGTVDGVFSVLREKRDTWRAIRRGLDGVHIHALLVEPQTGSIFAGAHKGSILASGDSCESWECRDAGLAEKDVYCLNAACLDGKVKLYAGTEPAHLFESENLGGTWKEISSLRDVPSVGDWTFPAPPHIAHVKNITFGVDGKTIYTCIEQGGLLKSENDGVSWEELHGFENISFDLPEGAFADDIHRLVISPLHPKWFYLSGGSGICRSQDGGQTWQHLTTPTTRVGYPDPLLLHPQREGLVFSAGAEGNPRTWRQTHDANSRILRSRDGGETWEILGSGLPEHIRGNFEAMTMEVWDDSYALFAGTTDGDIFYSDDEGDTWSKIAENLPAISKGGHYLRLR